MAGAFMLAVSLTAMSQSNKADDPKKVETGKVKEPAKTAGRTKTFRSARNNRAAENIRTGKKSRSDENIRTGKKSKTGKDNRADESMKTDSSTN